MAKGDNRFDVERLQELCRNLDRLQKQARALCKEVQRLAQEADATD